MTRERHMMSAVVLVLVSSGAVWAQSEPTWNRSVQAFSVLPDAGGGGTYDIHVIWSMEVLDPTDGIGGSLGTEVALIINGTEVSSTTVLGSDPGSSSGGGNPGSCGLGSCSGSCGGVNVDGNAMTLLCLEPVPLDCDCLTPPLTTLLPGQALTPNDEIMVLLRPAPGAIPDTDISDDTLTQTFDGDPIFWDRRIVSVNIAPSAAPGGVAKDSFFDIILFTELRANYSGLLNLRSEAELWINDVLVDTTNVPGMDLDLTWNPCNPACDIGCAVDAGPPFLGTCQSDVGGIIPCSCRYQPVPDVLFPAVSVHGGDVVMVLLKPAPEALPPLPPFEEDDRATLVCGDGVIDEPVEECDDANTGDGDGCSATCTVEPNSKCTGEPSVCITDIPAVSEWGLVVMSLLVLTAGTLVYARRRPAHA